MKKAVGIICEFNPFHNGHLHFINEVKRKYDGYTVILILNGYFLERGEASVLTKEAKTKLSLMYGVDIVIDHFALFGTQSADTFANSALTLLNHLCVDTLVFGSEKNNKDILVKIANTQLYDESYDNKVQSFMKTGINYPSALAKALELDDFEFTPNDLLGISYTKAIIKNKFNINIDTVQRTNSFHDNQSNDTIVSASNIRIKLKNKIAIDTFVPPFVKEEIVTINKSKLFEFLKLKILTDDNLDKYLDVDEGIENKLRKEIILSQSLEDFILSIKTKRYTYNKINRMLTHILIGLTKKDAKNAKYEYIRILGFNSNGKEYLNSIKKDCLLSFNINRESKMYEYEKICALIYEMITDKEVFGFENKGKPLHFK